MVQGSHGSRIRQQRGSCQERTRQIPKIIRTINYILHYIIRYSRYQIRYSRYQIRYSRYQIRYSRYQIRYWMQQAALSFMSLRVKTHEKRAKNAQE